MAASAQLPFVNRLTPTVLLLLGGLALHGLASWWLAAPGGLSIDEGLYLFELRAFAEGDGLAIWNGWTETPSVELEMHTPQGPWLLPAEGALRAQYPWMFPWAAAWAYGWLGFGALVLLNVLAWGLTLLMVAALARRVSPHPAAPGLAAVLWALCTFSWPYSVAGWPHATSAALALGAVLATVRALDTRGGPAILWAAAAGGAVGIGLAVRLDMLFVLPAVGIPLLLATPRRWAAACAAGAGFLPGLLSMSLANQVKYGIWWPFSYGPQSIAADASFYLRFAPALTVAGLCVVGSFLARSPVRRVYSWALLGLLSVVVLAVPSSRDMAFRSARGVASMVVDLAIVPGEQAGEAEYGAVRDVSEALIYPYARAAPEGWAAGPKKALLQSCPWLVVLLLPLAAMLRRKPTPTQLALLGVPVFLLLAFGPSMWHGGLCLQLRYFNPALGVLSVLGAVGLLELARGVGWRMLAACAVLAPGAALLVGLGIDPITAPWAEAIFLHLRLPLWLAFLTAVPLLWVVLRSEAHAAVPALCSLALCFGFSTGIVFGQDFRLERSLRQLNVETGRAAAELVDEDSLFFAGSVDPFFELLKKPRVRLASPHLDDFADLPRLTALHRQAGRRVYAAFPAGQWAKLLQEGTLGDVRLIGRAALPNGWILGELDAAEAGGGGAAP